MEICYYWTDRLGYEKHNKGFNFGSELKFSYDYNNKKLTVEEDDLYIKNFFNVYSDEQISNVTAVVGRNGVGKSTFLEEVKSLYVQGGILAKKDEKKKLYDHKKILVIKNKNNYEVVHHKDLILGKKKYLKEYMLEYTPYGDDENFITKQADLFLIEKHQYLKETFCIYFSYAFDNNFYTQKTSTGSKYFDLSTKGILNEMNYKLIRNGDSYFDVGPREPRYRIVEDVHLDVGLLREYYVRENKKRIQLLNSDIGRGFITKHNFFPTKAYLNLDYILQRQDNFLNDNAFKNPLRSESRNRINGLEKEFYSFINSIPLSKYNRRNKLALAQQTYLRRILDSYFKDVNTLIFLDSFKDYRMGTKALSEFSKQIENKDRKRASLVLEDNANHILWLMDNFKDEITRFVTVFLTNNKDRNESFDDSKLAAMTESYKDFVIYFNKTFLGNNPAVHIKEDTTYLNSRRVGSAEGASSVSVGIVEIDLTSQGLSLLAEFLHKYSLIKSGSDFIKIDWDGLSTGEDALLGMFSRFFVLAEKFKGENSEEDGNERLVILLDEIEHSLHPEWQRGILNNLIEFLPIVFDTVETLQIILATNVPFIIADIPTSNIIYLEKNEVQTEKGHTQIVDKPSQTFAANIHSLLMSNFFMDTTIGKFSEQKIKKIVSYLNDSVTFPENQSNTSLKEEKQYSQEEIRKTIKIIGEPVIRTKLESLYINKFRKDTEESVTKQFLSGIESDNNIPEDIKLRLRTMINDLGKEQDND
ncbi:hypothetical protein WKH56_07530 [Priestia sp. SB1]|uniref:hypothetical protein n=1 Tax=Priestia sp. SB1 TaxID=3132359 RepID=UPI00316F3CA7